MSGRVQSAKYRKHPAKAEKGVLGGRVSLEGERAERGTEVYGVGQGLQSCMRKRISVSCKNEGWLMLIE